MSDTKRPGDSTGKNGGIYQEEGPRGGKKPNYSTVPDHTKLPPTTKPGNVWRPVKVTPDSQR